MALKNRLLTDCLEAVGEGAEKWFSGREVGQEGEGPAEAVGGYDVGGETAVEEGDVDGFPGRFGEG